MADNSERKQPELITFSPRRFHAARELRGLSMEGMGRQCEISARHIWYVVNQGRKPSLRVLAKLRALLGESGWLFATGQADTLHEEEGSHAAG